MFKNSKTAALFVALSFVCLSCSDRSAERKPQDPPEVHQPGVVLLRYNRGSGSTEQRELGFLETMEREFPTLHVLSSSTYAGTTPEAAKQAALDVLEYYGEAVLGIFAVCEPNADGVLRALEESGKTGKVRFVGFDPNPATLAALGEGKMDGIVLQDPVQMGYVAVQTMISQLNGAEIVSKISTGEYIATPETLEDEELQPMLRPPRFTGKSFEPENTEYTIAVIPKGRTHGFWESVRLGAENAAEEAGNVKIRFKAPLLEVDLKGQIEIIEEFLAEGISGICLVPIDAVRVVPVVQQANEQGVPVLIFDSDLYDSDRFKICYVATDNYEGGALAARRLAAVLGHKPLGSAQVVAETEADNPPGLETTSVETTGDAENPSDREQSSNNPAEQAD